MGCHGVVCPGENQIIERKVHLVLIVSDPYQHLPTGLLSGGFDFVTSQVVTCWGCWSPGLRSRQVLLVSPVPGTPLTGARTNAPVPARSSRAGHRSSYELHGGLMGDGPLRSFEMGRGDLREGLRRPDGRRRRGEDVSCLEDIEELKAAKEKRIERHTHTPFLDKIFQSLNPVYSLVFR